MVVCFKFLGLFFHVGLMIFLGLWVLFVGGFSGGWCLDMENVNITGGGRGMQQEENQLPMSGYLGMFETYMSGYLGLFETCD